MHPNKRIISLGHTLQLSNGTQVLKIRQVLPTFYTLYVRLSQKTKKLEYQKSLLTMDVGWLDKLPCKISASYLENRKSGGHLNF